MENKRVMLKPLMIFLLMSFINFIVFSCSFLEPSDILNVQLEGYIYDNETKKPLEDCKIIIFNSSYIENEGDYTDYSSYLNHDTIPLVSDKNGKFLTILKRSADIHIRIYKKGYELGEVYNLKPKKKTKKTLYLKKGISEEADLLKPNEIIEIEE